MLLPTKRLLFTLLLLFNFTLGFNQNSNDLPANKNVLIVDSLNYQSYLFRRSNPKLSLEMAIEALEICKGIDYINGYAFAIHNTGTAKAVLGRYDHGMIDLMEASRIREEIGDFEGLVSTYNNIGHVYSEMGNDAKALEFFERALEYQQKTGLKKDLGIVLNNVGHVNFRSGNFDIALTFFYQALEVNIQDGDERGIGASKSNIGTVYRSLGEYQKALDYHLEALLEGEKFNDKYGVITTLRSVAEDYIQLNNLNKSIEYAIRSLKLAQEIGSLGEEKNTAGLLAVIYENTGQFKESAKYHKLESRLKDSLFSNEKAEFLGRMQAAFEIENKAKENEYLKKEQEIRANQIRTQRSMLYLSGIAILLAIAFIWYVIQANKKVRSTNRDLLELNEEIITQKEVIQDKVDELDNSNQELQKINHIKDKLISVIAHDLKNPFNNISGYSEIIISRLESYTPSELLSFIRIIHENSSKGSMLLDNLLQWSQLQTQTVQFLPTEQQLTKLINEELLLIQHIASEKKIEIELEIDKQMKVFVDANMLRTIIRNLISNSLKFTRNGGKINIKAERETSYTLLSVSDSGIGIEPSIKEKLFTGQAGVTSANVKGEMGTGLGLMLCKDFVDMHKGDIWVESEPGKGSTFHIKFPNSN